MLWRKVRMTRKNIIMNKKKPFIIHDVTSVKELQNRIRNNAGAKKIIDESLSLKERLKQPMSYRYDWIIRQLPNKKNMKILDVGCWSGMLSYLLKHMNHDVTALDSNEKYIKLVDKHVKCKTVHGNVEEVSTLIKEQFDVIIASQVLEHVKDDNKAIKEMHNILKDKGIMIITVPIQKNLLSKEHHHFYNFYDIMDLFDKNNLGSTYTISKLNKFKKYDRPKNIYGVVYVKNV